MTPTTPPRTLAAITSLQSPARDLEVLDTPLADLRPWDRNPRTVKPERLEQLMAMLEAAPEMLQARPLIALLDGTVIAGNQRLAAAAALGWATIPCVRVDLDESEAIEWAFRDNNPIGETDDDLAAELLGELEARGRPLAMTGFAEFDRDALLRRTRPRGPQDDAPPAPARPKSKRGRVYELGPHLVMCGDASSEADTRALFAPPGHHGMDLVDCIWTDPPYGVKYVGKTADALTIENDVPEGLRALIADALRNVLPGLAPHARFYIASPAGPMHGEFLAAIADVGWRLHETLVWVKQRLVLGHSDYHYRHEPILYGWATKPEWVGRPGRGKHRGSCWYGGNARDSVFEVASPARSEEHPTMKPVELIERMLANSTQGRSIVYDPFAGSGSTLIACDKLGLRARLMELDPGYCDVIRRRYADYVGDPDLAP